MLEDVALVFVVEALSQWEPRVDVTDVTIEREARLLKIGVRFNIVDVNALGRTILVPNLTEVVPVQLAA
jgi:phage baseplate assembly protein W